MVIFWAPGSVVDGRTVSNRSPKGVSGSAVTAQMRRAQCDGAHTERLLRCRVLRSVACDHSGNAKTPEAGKLPGVPRPGQFTGLCRHSRPERRGSTT